MKQLQDFPRLLELLAQQNKTRRINLQLIYHLTGKDRSQNYASGIKLEKFSLRRL